MAIFAGIMLITVPKTKKNGPKKEEFTLAIQAVDVLPILVPKTMSKLFRNDITPELANVTVSDDTKELDWIMAVTMAPRKKPPSGIWVILPIHLASLSFPKPSISLLKFCKPWTNKVIAAIMAIIV